MAVYQEKDKGTWRVVFRYTDFTGERKQTQKRGFKTKREATAWSATSAFTESWRAALVKRKRSGRSTLSSGLW